MASMTRAEAIAELRHHECSDVIQKQAISRACEVIAASEIAGQLEELEVVVLNPEQASAGLRASNIYTANCKSLLLESLVIVNLGFLAELEGALRAFASAGSFYAMPQFQSDQALFNLVRDLRPTVPEGPVQQWVPDPWTHLRRLRRLTSGYGAASREGDREEDLRAELSLVVLFFVAHEVGHLLDRKDVHGFGAYLPPGADLEHRTANAVARMVRHVEDFTRHKHGLPGFEAVTRIDSDLRASVERLKSLLGDVEARHDQWFDEENSADEWANRLICEHLRRVDGQDRHAALRTVYLLCRGIFGAALYSWYADLLTFYDGVGIDQGADAKGLTLAMMRDRRNYIRAASLFGEYHRNTLMRGEIAIEAVLKNHTAWFEHCEWSRSRLDAVGPELPGQAAHEKWWVEETVLRYCLLGMIVDTAVKMAYVGAAASQHEQSLHAPPPLLMKFDSIREAVERLTRRPR